MRLRTKKGYFTLEAAVFLPLFIMGVLTLGYLINIFSTAENVTHSVLDEAGHLAARAYGSKAAPFFPERTENRLRKENRQLEAVKIHRFRYLYQEGGRNGLISMNVRYRIRLPAPLNMIDSFEMESRVRCRGFIGSRNGGKPVSFDEMEKNADSEPVLIFPMWGQRYHNEVCGYVKANARQSVLTSRIKKLYNPCQLCKPDELALGSYVYCFPDTGRAYHKGSCNMIDKYTVEIEKEDALAKGYTPCSKCKGGQYGDS